MKTLHSGTPFRVRRVVLVSVLVAALLLALSAAIPLVTPASAGGETGGVTRYFLSTLAEGSTSYTALTYITSSLAFESYGAVDVQLTIDVTGTQAITLTPQYAIGAITGACTTVTEWFTATDYVRTTAQLTNTVQEVAVVPSLSKSGDGAVGREFPVYGRCFRAKLATSAAGETFTPTIYLRLVNRQ